MLNLANVKYILTSQPLPQARFALVYSGELSIYQNPGVLPRACEPSAASWSMAVFFSNAVRTATLSRSTIALDVLLGAKMPLNVTPSTSFSK